MTRRIALLLVAFMAGTVPPVFGCFLIEGSPRSWVKDAEAIVRVRAVDLARAPAISDHAVGSEEMVRFQILEVLKGEPVFSLVVPGRLENMPDFNDRSAPYVMVRPGGRGGGCFARNYQQGGEFLMLLKNVDGKLTPYWSALGATNEQLRGADDPWLDWVRRELQRPLETRVPQAERRGPSGEASSRARGRAWSHGHDS